MEPHLPRTVPLAVLALSIAGLAGTGARGELLPRFPPTSVWHQDVTAATVHPDSASMIATLDGLGGWGLGRFQIDFSFYVVHADPGAPVRTIVEHSTYDDYYLPDCEPVGSTMPVPADARIEGTTGLVCDNAGADCHLLVVQGGVLYEAYSATAAGPSGLEALCLAVWYLGADYPPEGRGDHCTSADAAGFPIAPLLFNADEIAASLADDPSGGGDLGHAIRFILPNSHMATDATLGGVDGRLYVRPATHAGGPSGPEGTVPYGARLRLRSDFPMDGYGPAARVLLHTFQRYGIVLSDGGSVALTGERDFYTTAKWTDLGVDEQMFFETPDAQEVEVTDFEVLDTGPRIGETYDCVRTGVHFADGFESGGASAWSSAGP